MRARVAACVPGCPAACCGFSSSNLCGMGDNLQALAVIVLLLALSRVVASAPQTCAAFRCGRTNHPTAPKSEKGPLCQADASSKAEQLLGCMRGYRCSLVGPTLSRKHSIALMVVHVPGERQCSPMLPLNDARPTRQPWEMKSQTEKTGRKIAVIRPVARRSPTSVRRFRLGAPALLGLIHPFPHPPFPIPHPFWQHPYH